MHERVRLAASQESDPVKLRSQSRQQSGWEIDSIEACRREGRRCPRSDFQIEGIDVARGASQQNKDDILGRAHQNSWILRGGRDLSAEIHRRQEVTGNADARNFEEDSSIDDLFVKWFHGVSSPSS